MLQPNMFRLTENNMKNNFNKALRLLDIGQTEKAVTILNEIREEARKMKDNLLYIQVNCVLGDLYFQKNLYDISKEHLVEVIITPYHEDAVNYEKLLAKELLDKIEDNF